MMFLLEAVIYQEGEEEKEIISSFCLYSLPFPFSYSRGKNEIDASQMRQTNEESAHCNSNSVLQLGKQLLQMDIEI